ncbi:hypothetical protein ACPWT1_10605 [Ramlibacter sp. MMS24-I3-19]|uniref:hypothetical protein n=1 Tax=Ramlibacter sp. MMS24-I3-19 TaxID=3416606 RepID=UPI003CFF6285
MLLQFLGEGDLLRALAFVGQALAELLAHEHRLVAQLQPHRATATVFEPDRARAALDRVHQELVALGRHHEQSGAARWRHLDGGAELARDVADVDLLGGLQVGVGELDLRVVVDGRDLLDRLLRRALQLGLGGRLLRGRLFRLRESRRAGSDEGGEAGGNDEAHLHGISWCHGVAPNHSAASGGSVLPVRCARSSTCQWKR